jgi:hypothetical protein
MQAAVERPYLDHSNAADLTSQPFYRWMESTWFAQIIIRLILTQVRHSHCIMRACMCSRTWRFPSSLYGNKGTGGLQGSCGSQHSLGNSKPCTASHLALGSRQGLWQTSHSQMQALAACQCQATIICAGHATACRTLVRQGTLVSHARTGNCPLHCSCRNS